LSPVGASGVVRICRNESFLARHPAVGASGPVGVTYCWFWTRAPNLVWWWSSGGKRREVATVSEWVGGCDGGGGGGGGGHDDQIVTLQ
jgi:hypothetical protein